MVLSSSVIDGAMARPLTAAAHAASRVVEGAISVPRTVGLTCIPRVRRL